MVNFPAGELFDYRVTPWPAAVPGVRRAGEFESDGTLSDAVAAVKKKRRRCL